MSTVIDKLKKLHASTIEQITVSRGGVTIYRGTILNLIRNRKDIINLQVCGEIKHKVNKGYYCTCK